MLPCVVVVAMCCHCCQDGLGCHVLSWLPCVVIVAMCCHCGQGYQRSHVLSWLPCVVIVQVKVMEQSKELTEVKSNLDR